MTEPPTGELWPDEDDNGTWVYFRAEPRVDDEPRITYGDAWPSAKAFWERVIGRLLRLFHDTIQPRARSPPRLQCSPGTPG